jgi:phosphoribosyl-ATP pyrophosphohydrolase/phosphoribosyl-AMP cyclohydrolase
VSDLRFEPTQTPAGQQSLIPVVAQDCLTGEVRMLAWATAEAVQATLTTGRATFFSRSRGELWEKGGTSGNTLEVESVLADCDADALLYLVRPQGPTCHTGAPSCFFRRLGSSKDGAGLELEPGDATRAVSTTALARLDEVLVARQQSTAEKSYVKSLYDGGAPKIGAKLREEADELARAVADEDEGRVVSEAADVLSHVMIALRSRGKGIEDVLRELDGRAGRGGHDEKRARAARKETP